MSFFGDMEAIHLSKLALIVSIISAVLALISISFNFIKWLWSGGRIKVRIQKKEHSRDRLQDTLQVIVACTGRQAAFINQIEIGHRYIAADTSSTNDWITDWDLPLAPDGGIKLPARLDPTDSISAEIKISELAKIHGYNKSLKIIARALRGDGKAKKSKVFDLRTPKK